MVKFICYKINSLLGIKYAGYRLKMVNQYQKK